MLTLLLGAAIAASPGAAAPILVEPTAVRAVHTVHLASPWEYTWTAEPLRVTDLTVLVVRVDPGLGRPRQTASPVLYLDDQPLEVLARSADFSCLVTLAPRRDVSGAVVYWGPDELPETVDHAAGARSLAQARRAGARALTLDAAARNEVSFAEIATFQLYASAMLQHCP